MKKYILFILFYFCLTKSIGQIKKYPLILTEYDVEEVFEQQNRPYSYYRLRDTKEIYTGWYFTIYNYKYIYIQHINNGTYGGENFYWYKLDKKDGRYYLESVSISILDYKYVIDFDKKHKIKKVKIFKKSKITIVLYKGKDNYVIKEEVYTSDNNVIKKKYRVTAYKALDKVLNNLVFPYALNDYLDLFNSMESRYN